MEIRLIELSSKMCMTLIESKKKLDIKDLVLPWKPLWLLLEKELFPKQRRTGLTNISTKLLDLAEFSQRFFDPNETEEMLKTFLPRLDGSELNVSIFRLYWSCTINLIRLRFGSERNEVQRTIAYS